MSPKSKLIAGAVVVAGIFLLGFVPQFLAKRRIQSELETNRHKLSVAQLQIQIDELRGIAGRTLLAASQQNYGTARQYSTELFNKVRVLADASEDPALKEPLLKILESRDAITSGLAQADASIVPELQSLLQRAYDLPNADSATR